MSSPARARIFVELPEAIANSLLGQGTRRKVLDATVGLVEASGMGGLTVQQLLDEAKIARRTFYKHFKSKEDVMRQLFEVGTRMMIYMIDASRDREAPPEVQLTRGIETYLDMQVRGGRIMVELIEDARRPDSMLYPRRQQVLATLIETMGEAYEQYSGKRVDPLTFRALLLGLEGLIIDIHSRGPFTSEARDRVRDVFLPIMIRTLGLADHDRPELAPPPPESKAKQGRG